MHSSWIFLSYLTFAFFFSSHFNLRSFYYLSSSSLILYLAICSLLFYYFWVLIFLFKSFFFSHFFIVVQVQLSPFLPHHSPWRQPSPPPTIDPTPPFGFVYVSFIHIPETFDSFLLKFSSLLKSPTYSCMLSIFPITALKVLITALLVSEF